MTNLWLGDENSSIRIISKVSLGEVLGKAICIKKLLVLSADYNKMRVRYIRLLIK